MRVLGLRFLLHVSRGCPDAPPASLRCCCLQQQHDLQQQEESKLEHHSGNRVRGLEANANGPHESRKKPCVTSLLSSDHQRPQQQTQLQRVKGDYCSSSEDYASRPSIRVTGAFSRASGPSQVHLKHRQQEDGFDACSCGCRDASSLQGDSPAQGGPRYTPVYSKSVMRFLVSVNAGDPKLYVGGGSINLAFLRAINEETARMCVRGDSQRALDFDWGQKMIDVHASAFAAAKRAPTGTAALRCPGFPEGSTAGLPFSRVFCIVPTQEEAEAAKIKGNDGLVCLDMFKKEMRPLNEKNIGMAYVVGPKGWMYTPENFYRTLFVLARNLLRVIVLYNTQEARGPDGGFSEKWPPVQQLRMPLVSGGLFRGDKDPFRLAGALIKGLLAAAKEHQLAARAAKKAPSTEGIPGGPSIPSFAKPQTPLGEQGTVEIQGTGLELKEDNTRENPEQNFAGRTATQHNKLANTHQPFRSPGDNTLPLTVQEPQLHSKRTDGGLADLEVAVPPSGTLAQGEGSRCGDFSHRSSDCCGSKGSNSCTNCCCCCCCGPEKEVLPVIEFAKVEGDLFYHALLREWHSIYGSAFAVE